MYPYNVYGPNSPDREAFKLHIESIKPSLEAIRGNQLNMSKCGQQRDNFVAAREKLKDTVDGLLSEDKVTSNQLINFIKDKAKASDGSFNVTDLEALFKPAIKADHKEALSEYLKAIPTLRTNHLETPQHKNFLTDSWLNYVNVSSYNGNFREELSPKEVKQLKHQLTDKLVENLGSENHSSFIEMATSWDTFHQPLVALCLIPQVCYMSGALYTIVNIPPNLSINGYWVRGLVADVYTKLYVSLCGPINVPYPSTVTDFFWNNNRINYYNGLGVIEFKNSQLVCKTVSMNVCTMVSFGNGIDKMQQYEDIEAIPYAGEFRAERLVIHNLPPLEENQTKRVKFAN